MKTISPSDTLFATVYCNRVMILSLKLDGFSSMSQVMDTVTRNLGGFDGPVNTVVRNGSRGWVTVS